MHSIAISQQIDNFIRVVDSLGLDGHEKYLHVNSKLGTVCHIDSYHKKSGLGQINKIINSILSKDGKDVPVKKWQQLRRSFSCVISNYKGKNASAQRAAAQLMKKIPGKPRITFAGVGLWSYNLYGQFDKTPLMTPKLKVIERKAKDYKPRLLLSKKPSAVKDNSSLGILMIQNAIRKKYFVFGDFSGKYVVALFGDALAATQIEIADRQKKGLPPLDSVALFCSNWLEETVDLLNESTDLFDPRQFQHAWDNGWIPATKKNINMLNEIGSTWLGDEEREVKVRFPPEYIDLIDKILCDDDVEEAIENFFKSNTDSHLFF